MITPTAKQEALKLIETLPEDASFEEIQYHLYVRQKIEAGLRDVEAGNVLSHEEVERRMVKWLAR